MQNRTPMRQLNGTVIPNYCGGIHQCLLENKYTVLAQKANNVVPCGTVYDLFNHVHFSLHTHQHHPHIH